MILPEPPAVDALKQLGIRADEIRTVTVTDTWWRLHFTVGEHVLAWNAFRRYGPVARFDPHPAVAGDKPATEHTNHGTWYGAADAVTALGEAFQHDRVIDRRRGLPFLTAVRFQHEFTLLDIAPNGPGRWPTRAGGNYALATAEHAVTQRWANRISRAFPDLCGLHYTGLYGGGECIALFLPAANAMPDRPVFSRPLIDPALQDRLGSAAQRLGYDLV